MVNKAPVIQIEKDGENPWFNMAHGLVLETAVCRVSIRNLKNLLIT